MNDKSHAATPANATISESKLEPRNGGSSAMIQPGLEPITEGAML